MQKKLGGERGYLVLEDLRIKSKFLRSNMPICEVGRSGERKKPEREEKEEEEGSGKKIGAGLKHHLGAIDLGVVLGTNNHGTKIYGANIYGAKLPARSPPRQRRAQVLCAKIYGAETCKLGATNDGAELRVQILKAYLQGHICEKKIQKKAKKTKKNRYNVPAAAHGGRARDADWPDIDSY